MEISNAYRQARRNVSIVCGLSLAWAAAQLELKSLAIGPVRSIDISGASIPILLSFIIIFMLIRMTIEFMMQSKEVRRWNIAQVDYKITLNLIRIAFLALVASTLTRSIEAVITIIITAVSILWGYFLLVLLPMFILMPLNMWIRSRQGRISAASSASWALNWSILITGIVYIGLFVHYGKRAFDLLPFISNLANPPDTTSIIVFVGVCIVIILSWFFEHRILQKIFAFEPKHIVEKTAQENGRIGVSFKDNPKHPDNVAQKAKKINNGES